MDRPSMDDPELARAAAERSSGWYVHPRQSNYVGQFESYIYIVHIAAQPNEISILSPSKS